MHALLRYLESAAAEVEALPRDFWLRGYAFT